MRTISEYHTEYLRVAGLAESSRNNYRRAVLHWIRLFGDMPPDLVTLGHAEDYRALLLKEGKAAATVNNYLGGGMHSFFAWMQHRKYLDNNPLHKIKRCPVKKHLRKQVGPQELEALFRAAALLWRVVVGLIFATGVRRGELLNLVWPDDVDLDRRRLYVRCKADTKRTWAWRIKGHREREVPLQQQILLPDMVVDLHGAIQRLAAVSTSPYLLLTLKQWQTNIALREAGRLTEARANKPWPSFNAGFKALFRKAGLRVPKCPHDLRATFITNVWDEEGEYMAQMFAGHASGDTTRGYITLNQGQLVSRFLAHKAEKHYVTTVP